MEGRMTDTLIADRFAAVPRSPIPGRFVIDAEPVPTPESGGGRFRECRDGR
jgi:hypothetical protein